MSQDKPKVPVSLILKLIYAVINMITTSIEKSKQKKFEKQDIKRKALEELEASTVSDNNENL